MPLKALFLVGVVLTSLATNVTRHVASFIIETKPGKLSKSFLSETSLRG